jgi:serine/threonine-protein kinase
MPPEQFIDFKTVTYNADIYSMGATLYYLVTGNMVKNFPPQNEMGNLDELVKIIVSPNIPVEKRNPNIPRKLAKIINKSIDIDLNNRYQSAEKFKRKLEEFLSFS